MFARLAEIPVLVWVFVGLVVLTGGRYVQLWVLRRGHGAAERESLRGLRLLYDGLATFAKFNNRALPESIAGDDWAFARGAVLRPLPRWPADPRLVIAYAREPRHRLIEFPALRPGRAVLLGTGKVIVVSDGQFEQLMKADDRLREELGLEPAAIRAEERVS